jgi:hypothetical protein
MDEYGNIMQILKTFTGRLQLCTVNNDSIALVYPHSNTIHYLNIKTSQKSSYFQIPDKIPCFTIHHQLFFNIGNTDTIVPEWDKINMIEPFCIN